jgi:pyruvate dehydrogenase E2 component (dihydrolipoamide acetyltransferase)
LYYSLSHTYPALVISLGTLAKWLKAAGDEVAVGDGIAEIGTDKASMTFESTEDFFVAKVLVAEGAEVPVGSPIMVTVEDKADIAAFADFVAPAAALAAAPAAAPVPVAPVAAAVPAPVVAAVVAAPVAASVAVAPAPVRAASVPVAAVPAAASTFVRGWGTGAKKSAIASILAQEQNAYIAKYGRTGHKTLA